MQFHTTAASLALVAVGMRRSTEALIEEPMFTGIDANPALRI